MSQPLKRNIVLLDELIELEKERNKTNAYYMFLAVSAGMGSEDAGKRLSDLLGEEEVNTQRL